MSTPPNNPIEPAQYQYAFEEASLPEEPRQDNPYLQVQAPQAIPASLQSEEDELPLQPPAPSYRHYHNIPPSPPDSNAQAEEDPVQDTQSPANDPATHQVDGNGTQSQTHSDEPRVFGAASFDHQLFVPPPVQTPNARASHTDPAHQVDGNNTQSHQHADAPKVFGSASFNHQFFGHPPPLLPVRPFVDLSNLSMEQIMDRHAELVRAYPPPEPKDYIFEKDEPGVQELIDAYYEIENGITSSEPVPPRRLYAWPAGTVKQSELEAAYREYYPDHPAPTFNSNQQLQLNVQGPEDDRSPKVNEEGPIPLDDPTSSPVDGPSREPPVVAVASGSQSQPQATTVAPAAPGTIDKMPPPPPLDPNTSCHSKDYSGYDETFPAHFTRTLHPYWVPRDIIHHICRVPGCGELIRANAGRRHSTAKGHTDLAALNGCPWIMPDGTKCSQDNVNDWGQHISKQHFMYHGGWCMCCGHFFTSQKMYDEHVVVEV